jgi:hypothetical protein
MYTTPTFIHGVTAKHSSIALLPSAVSNTVVKPFRLYGSQAGTLNENDKDDLSLLKYTGRFIMFSVITNIYNKKTKGPILMELFTATGKLKKFF